MMKLNRKTVWGMASLIVVAGLAVLMCKAHGANTTIYIEPEPDDGHRVWALFVPQKTGDAPIVYEDGKAVLGLEFDKLTDLTAANFHFEGSFEPDIRPVSLEGDIMKPELSVEDIPENGTYVKVSIVGKDGEYTFSPLFMVWNLRTGVVEAFYPDPILSDLVVEYTDAVGNLIVDFDPYIKTYVIHPDAGRQVKVTKADFLPWADDVSMRLSNNDPLFIDDPVSVPAAGSSAEVIYVSVSKMFTTELLTSEYRVIIAPPQNGALDDRTLMYLDVFYENEDDSLISFSKSVTEYTVNVSEANQSSKIQVKYPLTSSEHSNVDITYGENEGEAVPVAYNEQDAVSEAVAVPAPGQPAKKFFVKVTANNGNNMNYTITIYPYTAPEATTSWSGTVTLNNLSEKTAVQVVVREANIYQSRTATVTDWDGAQGKWTLVAPASFEPVSFIVAITDNATSTEISRSKQYKKGRELSAGQVIAGSPVSLVVDGSLEVGKGVFSYQDVIDFNNHPNWNYSLVGDVTLANDWSGSPENYSARFYGNGYTIQNLRFAPIKPQYADGWCQGLFRSLGPSAQIHDLTIIVPDQMIIISSPDAEDSQTFFGAVTSYTDSLDIVFNGVTVRGSLTIGPESKSRHFSIGGFFGQLGLADGAPGGSSATFTNCVSDMDITLDGGTPSVWTNTDESATKAIGGFVGYVWASGVSFTNCYSTGSLNAKISPAQGGVVIGGFVSGAGGGGTTVITNCYSSVALDSDWYPTPNKWVTTNPQPHIIGGFFGTVEGGYNLTISKTLALNPNISVSKGVISVGRVIGKVDAGGTRSYSDLYARENMAVTSNGIDASSTLPDKTSTGKNGESKIDSFLQNEANWLGYGFADTVWDFSPLSTGGWPTLK